MDEMDEIDKMDRMDDSQSSFSSEFLEFLPIFKGSLKLLSAYESNSTHTLRRRVRAHTHTRMRALSRAGACGRARALPGSIRNPYGFEMKPV